MRSRALAFGGLFIGSALALLASQPTVVARHRRRRRPECQRYPRNGRAEPSTCRRCAGRHFVDACAADPWTPHTGGLLLLVGLGLAVVGILGLQPSADAVRGRAHGVSLAETFDLL